MRQQGLEDYLRAVVVTVSLESQCEQCEWMRPWTEEVRDPQVALVAGAVVDNTAAPVDAVVIAKAAGEFADAASSCWTASPIAVASSAS